MDTGLKTEALRPAHRCTNNRKGQHNSDYRLAYVLFLAVHFFILKDISKSSESNKNTSLPLQPSAKQKGRYCTFPSAELLFSNFYTPADCISPQLPHQLPSPAQLALCKNSQSFSHALNFQLFPRNCISQRDCS